MDKISLYLKESYEELKNKVTWPSWANLVDSAKVVLVTTVIITAIVFVMDLLSNSILNVVYGL
ncbi:MAG TPA: preprotein translocase subunit SecE [Saprospiraceae bacterium]|nr:preprotein translocase subunit SecE [Saprospiraceae bacterium]HNT20139.1 preprotein translocase subunit SecE [Saprospiraceae bacterium]